MPADQEDRKLMEVESQSHAGTVYERCRHGEYPILTGCPLCDYARNSPEDFDAD